MVHPFPPQNRKEHRLLRVTTVLAFLPAFALLLPYGVISARPLPTVGIAAMFFSAAFSTLVLRGGVRSPGLRACCDLLLAASIVAILIPRYVRPVRPSNGYCRMLNQPSIGSSSQTDMTRGGTKAKASSFLQHTEPPPCYSTCTFHSSGSSAKRKSKPDKSP